MAEIFVAYRQADAKAWALLLRDAVAARFGQAAVFLDRDALEAGVWAPQLAHAVRGCKVFLLVIGPGWLAATDGSGRSRLQQPDDVHRREVEAALGTAGVVVLPVLVDGARMPSASELPAALRRLADHQAFNIGDRAAQREADLHALIGQLQRLTGLQPPRVAWGGSGAGAYAATAAGSLIVALLIGAGYGQADMPLNDREWLVLVALVMAAGVGVHAAWRAARRARAGGGDAA